MIHREKLKWRCRRGTLELDIMLGRYLDRVYPTAGQNEQALFQALLNFSDAELLTFLVGEQLPEAKGMATLVKKIRTLSATGA